MKTIKQLREEIELNSEGIIPEPIHFKNVTKNSLEESTGLKKISKWLTEYDNDHLYKGRAFQRNNKISEKISEHHDIKGISKKHIINYTGTKSKIYNKELMNGKISKRNRTAIQSLKSSIKENPLKHDVHVYSGTSFDPRDHIKNGKMKSPAFISASHSKHVANAFARSIRDKKGNHVTHIIHFHLKKGDPALHINKYSMENDEHETIVHPTTLKYHKTEEFDNYSGILHIHHMSIAK